MCSTYEPWRNVAVPSALRRKMKVLRATWWGRDADVVLAAEFGDHFADAALVVFAFRDDGLGDEQVAYGVHACEEVGDFVVSDDFLVLGYVEVVELAVGVGAA